ncbi:hypothetical protein D6777_02945 [Candidatus Woesearchaeota archaeon]|nr:MAG: hypothetical protein D6777_02945 [Candidatus Woesearchaeota archaeon]
MNAKILYYLLENTSKNIKKKYLKLAIDATGLHIEDGSYHYHKELGETAKIRKNVKLSAAIDTQTQLVTAVKIRKSKASDTIDFKGLVKKTAKAKPIKIVVAERL